MDWDLKMPLWDLAELERDAVRSIGSVVVGPSGGCGGGFIALQADGLDCSVDLKLGGLGDFRPGKKCKDESRVPETFPAAVVSPSAPLKRPRPSGNGVQSACCSVEGCQADLSKCREYHRRHKVCEVHSKTPVVIVGGQEQRFCQQCSRFHLLPEFDEVKRSCRKRLDGHNRRRRKPQPDTANPGIFPNHQGSRFSACPQIFPTAASETSWAGIVKAEENTLFPHCSSQLADRGRHFSGLHSYNKERNRFPFLQQNEATLTSKNILGTSMDQAHHSAFTLSGSSSSSSSSNNSKMFSHGLTQVFHSDCALSLLSSPIQTPGMNKSHMMPPPDRITVGQPLVSCFQYDGFVQNSCSQASKSMSPIGFSCSTMEDEQVGGILVSDANNADIHCQSMLHVSGEGFSGRTSQTLPFSWH